MDTQNITMVIVPRYVTLADTTEVLLIALVMAPKIGSTSELQSQSNLVCRLLLEKKKKNHAEMLLHSEIAFRLTGKHGGSRSISTAARSISTSIVSNSSAQALLVHGGMKEG